MSTQRYRIEFKNILERTFLPEGISIEERNERLLPLVKHMSEHMPSKLFRYRDCSEMNFDAFNEDKLFAVTPPDNHCSGIRISFIASSGRIWYDYG